MDRRGQPDRHPAGRICREHVWCLRSSRSSNVSLLVEWKQGGKIDAEGSYSCCSGWVGCEPCRGRRGCGYGRCHFDFDSDFDSGIGVGFGSGGPPRGPEEAHDLSLQRKWKKMRKGERQHGREDVEAGGVYRRREGKKIQRAVKAESMRSGLTEGNK